MLSIALLLSKKMVHRIKQADKETEMMNEQVVETGKLASVGELAAGIAHEINNPVAIMVEEAGWIEDLLEEEDLKDGENLEEFKRALLQIRTQGRLDAKKSRINCSVSLGKQTPAFKKRS